MPVLGFWNCKSLKALKDHLIRATLPKLNNSGRFETCGKTTFLVCDSISTAMTFTTEAWQEIFNIQNGPLNCDSEKVLYLLNFKACDEALHVGKAKTRFRYRFNSYRSKHRLIKKGNWKVFEKLLNTHYCFNGHSGIDDGDFIIFRHYTCVSTHAQLKEREIFWQYGFRTFYLIVQNEKEKYLY